MRLFRLISRLLVFTSTLFLGGLLTLAWPSFADAVDWVFNTWDPFWAPRIVMGVAGLLAGVFVAMTLNPSIKQWRVNRAARCAAAERAATEMAERVSRENARREAADYQAWVVERLKPWQQLLDSMGESALFSEIEMSFSAKNADTRHEEMRLQDLWMMLWLAEKAVQFSGVDGRDNPAKVHQLLDHAFRIAGERDAWDRFQGISGAQVVISRFFRGQARDLTTRYGGAIDISNRFTRFTGWAVAKSFPPV